MRGIWPIAHAGGALSENQLQITFFIRELANLLAKWLCGCPQLRVGKEAHALPLGPFASPTPDVRLVLKIQRSERVRRRRICHCLGRGRDREGCRSVNAQVFDGGSEEQLVEFAGVVVFYAVQLTQK